MRRIYVCEDDVTGVFSAVYDAWKAGRTQEDAGLAMKGMIEMELFCEYVKSTPSLQKAEAVRRLIRKYLGEQAYMDIYYAALSCSHEKGTAIWQTMQEARMLRDSTKIMEHLSHPGVEKVFELSRAVGNEAHLFLEFVRFRELQNTILYAEIAPKNQVLTCIADHFSNRLPRENWMIFDKTHKMFLVHQSGREWFLIHGAEPDQEALQKYSGEEKEYERLWKGFCTSIAIMERRNPNLQRQHLPLRYRADMTEFNKNMTNFHSKIY